MVALVFSPSRWAVAMTSSQRALSHLLGEIFCRTRSTRISAPPPGMEAKPGVNQERWMTSWMVRLHSSAQ